MGKELIRVFYMTGKTIDKFKWTLDIPENFRLSRTIQWTFKSGKNLYTLEKIPREVLDDYSEKIGNEVIDFYISKLVSVPYMDLKKAHNGNFVL